MSNYNRGNGNDVDRTGEILSWVIVFILLVTIWPIGLILLFRKLRGYAKPAQNKTPHVQYVHNPVTNNKTAKERKRHPLLKKTGRFVSFLMLVISLVVLFMGIVAASNVIGQVIGSQSVSWSDVGLSSFFIIGGLFTFLSRNVVAHRYSRYKNYYAFIDGRGIVPLADLAQVAGVSLKSVKRDLQTMINNNYLEPGSYIDNELDCLVLSAEDARKLRLEIRDYHVGDDFTQPEEAAPNQYMAILAELREVNSTIIDESISKKVAHLEIITAKIFRIVEESPDKQSELRRFMSYYLPTTLKLVRSYATLEKQGVKGENISSTKQSIGNILDTLSTGYEQQLDKLFKSDAIDIAADINVLENLMQQDGLMADKSEFQVLEQ